MGEEFGGDLNESVFWGVDLSGSRFRDVNFTGVAMESVWLIDTEIDGVVERCVINGVDVTDYVNAHDPWQPLRSMVRASDVASMRAAWAEFGRAWADTIDQASRLTDEQRRASVNGEWSLVQTLRHLVFAIDKWFTVPLDGGTFHPIGMPNTGSMEYGFPGLDLDADPAFDEVLAARADRSARFAAFLERITDDQLDDPVEVMENGTEPLRMCIATVLEEEFEHRRYALRDLATFS